MVIRKRIYSAIQPSSIPTIGNYLGALKNWVKLQESFDCVFCVADYHAMTVYRDPVEFKKTSHDLYSILVAIGIDPEKSILYYQSQVSEHCELAWILNCYTHIGELNRMTQFKDKSSQHKENINAGLLTYPVLMAADILLYDTDLVPVGDDQKQHVEICRDIALRFNHVHAVDCFKIPRAYINSTGARIMDLQEPDKKMSKSGDGRGSISLLDEMNSIESKVKRAVTDSEGKIYVSEHKSGITNLLNIFSALKDISLEESEDFFATKNYSDLKSAVATEISSELAKIKSNYEQLQREPEYINRLIANNRQRAQAIASKKLSEVKRLVGLKN